MRILAPLRRLSLALGLALGLAVATPAAALIVVVCQGNVFTIWSGGQCFRCKVTICCHVIDGETECHNNEPDCVECGTGTAH